MAFGMSGCYFAAPAFLALPLVPSALFAPFPSFGVQRSMGHIDNHVTKEAARGGKQGKMKKGTTADFNSRKCPSNLWLRRSSLLPNPAKSGQIGVKFKINSPRRPPTQSYPFSAFRVARSAFSLSRHLQMPRNQRQSCQVVPGRRGAEGTTEIQDRMVPARKSSLYNLKLGKSNRITTD